LQAALLQLVASGSDTRTGGCAPIVPSLARLNADGISAGDRHLWCCRPPKRKSAEASAADLASVFSDRADEETLVIKRGMESGIASVPSI
jgi:hypothetical protein